MVLQQCAHFYNNIATEMIPCQKPMMLAQAVEFEKVWRAWMVTWLDVTGQPMPGLDGRLGPCVARRSSCQGPVSMRSVRCWFDICTTPAAGLCQPQGRKQP